MADAGVHAGAGRPRQADVDPSTGGIRTPLFDLHTELGGRMVNFGGHALPMRYGDGTVAEHRATRAAAGLFDVSHMGIIDVHPQEAESRGPAAREPVSNENRGQKSWEQENWQQERDAQGDGTSGLSAVAAWLERCVPADVVNLGVGKMRYTMFTNSSGGVVDDLIVSNMGDRLRLVVNAVRTDADLALLRAANGHPDSRLNSGPGRDHGDSRADDSSSSRADSRSNLNRHSRVRLRLRDDLALLALQGPAAASVLARWAPAAADLAFMSTATMAFGGIGDSDSEPVTCEVSRCGYTGEDGFEITVPADDAAAVARMLLACEEVSPAGLGARDTLRLEAGLPLVGHELTESITPAEAGLGWSIPKRRRTEGGFLGAELIAAQLRDGPPRRRVGIAADGRRPIRDGAALRTPDADATGTPVGIVTSGGFGPTFDAPVAMAYVAAEHSARGTELLAEGRKGPEPCRVSPLPFVEHRYWRPS